jgi:hypothetical protein
MKIILILITVIFSISCKNNIEKTNENPYVYSAENSDEYNKKIEYIINDLYSDINDKINYLEIDADTLLDKQFINVVFYEMKEYSYEIDDSIIFKKVEKIINTKNQKLLEYDNKYKSLKK